MKRHAPQHAQPVESPPRIVGGRLRGRKLAYSGDVRTRPMKERVREAIFNLLGTDVVGKQVLDLFAGTGALGFEAISRGAVSATLLEQHVPTARLMARSAAELELSECCRVVTGDTFYWAERLELAASPPWLVFCSPPYELYVSRHAELCGMLDDLIRRSPADSLFVVEADERFDFAALPDLGWDIRQYSPAIVAIGCHQG